MSSVIQVRVHPRLKHEVELLCERMGLTLSEAVRLFLNNLWLTKRLGFEVHIPRSHFTITCGDSRGAAYRPDLSLDVVDILRDVKNEEE